jgi:mono/diheme cytochrome c family protein
VPTARPLLLLCLVTLACRDDAPRFRGPLRLGGQVIAAETLQRGRETYVHYCQPCHGESGAGDGPAGRTLRPPPRDLRTGLYKFGGVVEGLPHDEDFRRLLRRGLAGTAMLAWDVPAPELDAVIQYIKTLAPVWRDGQTPPGQRIDGSRDPWRDRNEAIARGRLVYHGLASCHQCHPAYATRRDIHAASLAVGYQPITDFRPDLYGPVRKESDYSAGGRKLAILPPDFLTSEVRAGTAVADLHRTIAAGIPGTAMPAWHGSLPAADIWAMAHFVKSLLDQQGTPAAAALRHQLASQPRFTPPPSAPTP